MNCVELQASLAEIEDARSSEQRAHLKTCPECSALVAELDFIASIASELSAAEEPSPRVWNSIEIALRQEGLIRPQRASHSLIPSLSSPWAWARWMAPAAALLLITVGLSPDVKAQYADNLRRVNEYIQDAKTVVAENPNDEEARRSLMEAYQEKAMLFDLAMDRSLP
jgi:anti-sigma factor RsiW